MRLDAFRSDGPVITRIQAPFFFFGIAARERGKRRVQGRLPNWKGSAQARMSQDLQGYPRPPTQAHCPKNQPGLLSLKPFTYKL